MTKQEINTRLKESHHEFLDYVSALPPDQFNFSPPGKWSAGQQLDHIYRSTKPLAQALSLPKFVLRLLFGKSNRTGRSYDELVKKYMMKLEAGGKAFGRFIPEQLNAAQKGKTIAAINSTISKLTTSINKYSEKDLDTFILPHPLLGKLTLREMLFFTIHHVHHHQKLIARGLESITDSPARI